MAATKPRIRYTAREFATILEALEEYVRAARPELWTDFFESNLGQVLIEIVAYVGDVLSFSIDRVGQEVNISTAKRYASALRFAESVGYRPAGPTPATVDIKVQDYDTSNPTPDQLTIAKGTRVSAGQLVFETTRDWVFPAGTTDVTFTVVEGVEFEDTFTSVGIPNQEFTSTQTNVADGSWSVFVNGIEWEEVSNLLNAQTENVYRVRYDNDNRIIVLFGDGTYGNIPPDGADVSIRYRTTQGAAGAIAGNTINQQITGILGIPPLTSTVTLNVTNPGASSGESDRESLAHLRRFIPLFIRSVDKAITQQDYVTLILGYSGPNGTIGKGTALLRDSGTGPRILDIFTSYTLLPDGSPSNPYPPIGSIYIILDTDSAAPSGPGMYKWNGSTWEFVPTPAFFSGNLVDVYVWAPSGDTFANTSQALKDDLTAYLDARSLITVRVCVQDGITTPVDIDLGNVFVSPDYELSEVQTQVETALKDLFKRLDHQPGSTLRLSDIYEAVNDVDGVDYFDGVSTPTGDVTSAANELLVIGTITATYKVTPEQTPTVTGSCP